MVEAGDGAGLGEILLGDEPAVRHLNGHEAFQLLVVGKVDNSKASLAQDLLDSVATDA